MRIIDLTNNAGGSVSDFAGIMFPNKAEKLFISIAEKKFGGVSLKQKKLLAETMVSVLRKYDGFVLPCSPLTTMVEEILLKKNKTIFKV